ncbi:hypothetical protein LINPERPRIM_LOCUS11826 [Linum perenne]
MGLCSNLTPKRRREASSVLTLDTRSVPLLLTWTAAPLCGQSFEQLLSGL